jgi:hypothetical protein
MWFRKYLKAYNVNLDKEYFIEEFKTFSDIWKLRIRQSLDSNLDGFCTDSSFMGEYLGHLITGKKGTASAGSGFDLSDGNKADECKFAILVRGKICANCNNKNLFFRDKCSCGSSEFKYPSDSRWGIDSKAGIDYKDSLEYYVLQTLEPTENSSDCRVFKYKAFIVDAKNKYFAEYLINQRINSKKSDNCNLLPYSYDFYRSQPKKVIDLTIDLNKEGDYITANFFNLENGFLENMPISKVPKNILLDIIYQQDIIFPQGIPSKKDIETLAERLVEVNEINPANMEMFPLKNKLLNKNRGVTERKL